MQTRHDVPPGFLFGPVTAARQTEGSRFGGAGSCHRDSFAATPGNVHGGDDGRTACDHYHRWPADLDLMQAAQRDACRFSTSWAGVMPDCVNVNPEDIALYVKIADGMLKRGLKPFQTLNHRDLPSALADRGGWTNRDTCHRFADFAETIPRPLGNRVESIATINAPWCVGWLSRFIGIHAPGLRDIRAAARAIHHGLLAHGLAMDRLRGRGQRNLGIVLKFDDAQPATPADADVDAAALRDGIFNRGLIEEVTRKTDPSQGLAVLFSHFPDNWHDDMQTIGQPIDWPGVNYYTRHLHAHAPGQPWPCLRDVPSWMARMSEAFFIGRCWTISNGQKSMRNALGLCLSTAKRRNAHRKHRITPMPRPWRATRKGCP